jgi:tRNA G18 (ribose-2'-O)-methylase SpoU
MAIRSRRQMDRERGYFGIGIWNGKNHYNLGTLWRSAFIFGASFIFTVGRRYSKQSSDTVHAWKHIPLHKFDSNDDLVKFLPMGCPLIGVELDDRAHSITTFSHPERACYLLGAEDNGLSEAERQRCHALIQLPGSCSMNVASAGTVVMYDRYLKRMGGA